MNETTKCWIAGILSRLELGLPGGSQALASFVCDLEKADQEVTQEDLDFILDKLEHFTPYPTEDDSDRRAFEEAKERIENFVVLGATPYATIRASTQEQPPSRVKSRVKFPYVSNSRMDPVPGIALMELGGKPTRQSRVDASDEFREALGDGYGAALAYLTRKLREILVKKYNERWVKRMLRITNLDIDSDLSTEPRGYFDDRSVGLASGLMAMSYVLELTIPENVFATGDLKEDGRVVKVENLDRKLMAIGNYPTRDRKVLVPSDNEEEISRDFDGTVIPVETLESAALKVWGEKELEAALKKKLADSSREKTRSRWIMVGAVIAVVVVVAVIVIAVLASLRSDGGAGGLSILNTRKGDDPVIMVKNLTAPSNEWSRSTIAEPGDKLVFRIYYHNTSADRVARNTDLCVRNTSTSTNGLEFSGSIEPAEPIAERTEGVVVNLYGFEKGTEPAFIFDRTNYRWNPGYPGSNGEQDKQLIPSEVDGSIALQIGDVDPGKYGTAEFQGQIEGIVDPDLYWAKQTAAPSQDANMYINTTVSTNKKDWFKIITCKPGEFVYFRTYIKNVGEVKLSNLMTKSNLAPRTEYIDESTYLFNGSHIEGINASNNNITKGGINIGHYSPGASAVVVFKIRISKSLNKSQSKGGLATLTSYGVAKADEASTIQSNAIIRVTK